MNYTKQWLMPTEILKLYRVRFPGVTFPHTTDMKTPRRVTFFSEAIDHPSYADRAIAHAKFEGEKGQALKLYLPCTYICAVDTQDAAQFVSRFATYKVRDAEPWIETMYDVVVKTIHTADIEQVTPKTDSSAQIADIIPYRTRNVKQRLIEAGDRKATPNHILSKELKERTAPQLLHDLQVVAKCPRPVQGVVAKRLQLLLN